MLYLRRANSASISALGMTGILQRSASRISSFSGRTAEEGQQILASRQFVTVSRSIETPFNKGPLTLIDSAAILDQARKWQELYQKTIIAPSR